MPAKENIDHFLGKKFGRLLIVSDAGIIKKSRCVLCVCECGVKKNFRLSDIKNGSSTNCGCKRKETVSKLNTTHGLSRHPLNRVWRGILERCYYEKHIHFNRYGGRGITVCDEWRNDFMSFYNWAINNGWQQGLDVDRENNDLNYDSINCRIVTKTINARNKSSNRIIEFNGQSKCMAEWSDITGLSQGVIKDRLNKLKWSIEKTLTTPNLNTKNANQPN